MESRPAYRLRGALALPELTDAALETIGLAWGASPIVVRILHGRDVTEREHAQRVLDPRLQDLRNPQSMAGFTDAVSVIVTAIHEGTRVGVFGDYDVDGVTTATILSTFLRYLGVEVVAKVASRQGGYGFNLEAARDFAEAGAQLVLAGDCGTSDHESIAWLAERDIQVVVIDHHQVPDSKPVAVALINPHQPDCAFPFKGLCSAGVAFFLCAAIRTALQKGGWAGTLPDPRAWLDLVALGTVCDMVPLVEENRILVRYGLAQLDSRQRPGLRALLERAGVSPDTTINEGHLGFSLGPRLNAPGRLSLAEPAFNLLSARSDAEALPFAAEVEKFNNQRRVHQERIASEAFALLEADPRTADRAALVVAGQGWPAGVVGIAANSVVSRYRRPALILALDSAGGEVRGSVRSFGGIDVHRALSQCADLLLRFGGHKAAAGVSLLAENVEALVEAFDAAVGAQKLELGTECADTDGSDFFDGVLKLEDLELSLLDELDRLAPYGQGFPRPRFIVEGAVVERFKVIKQRHLSLVLRQGSCTREAIAFGKGDRSVHKGDRVGVSFTPERRTWAGRTKVQLLIDEIWQ